MLAATSQPIPLVVQQHAEESAHLRHMRSVLTAASHVKLHHLRRLDDRLAAHLDGLAVAGEYGSSVCEAALANPGVGEVFAATVRAIEEKDERRLDKLFALVGAVPQAQPGLISAFGWISANHLQGTGAKLLASKESLQRLAGIAACVMHGVDPGAALTQSVTDPDPQLRARALRAAGELGQRDLLAACANAFQDKDAACRFWAAWSAVLLGDRDKAARALESFALVPNAFRQRALRLLLKVLDLPITQQLLKTIAQGPASKRLLIQGAGIAGDAQYLPWLIGQMTDDKFARLAGESFSMITGLDLAYLDLERKPPENVEAGPTENPEDESVEMDPDDSLPWPDGAKIQAWWQANQAHYQQGVRYFMGEPPGVPQCEKVLREGYQRQRMAAAGYLCLLNPGTPLFNTRAPAWRQQRWLGRMGQASSSQQ
jgi:uncharacterized protein (TIGR02270 family)